MEPLADYDLDADGLEVVPDEPRRMNSKRKRVTQSDSDSESESRLSEDESSTTKSQKVSI